MYEEFKTIAEVQADWRVTPNQTSQINAYLKHGWVILAIHERGFTDQGDGLAHQCSVYIFGHREQDPTKPTKDTFSGVWS